MNYRPSRFNNLPEVVKNLLIINGLFFLATYVLNSSFNLNLVKYLGLHQFQSPDFRPHQLITHMFMHSTASINHLLFNMFGVWMFGKTLENIWGAKRFLVFYIVTGLGAAIIHLGITQYEILSLTTSLPQEITKMAHEGRYITSNQESLKLTQLIHTPTVGASGSLYGLLMAFGMLFPNTLIYLYFAIPIKTKYFVAGLGAIALISGIGNNPADNIAHFAHLGGMLFGYFLIKHWRKNSQHFY